MVTTWGLDVSTRALHAVGVGDDGRVVADVVVEPSQMDRLAHLVGDGAVVGIDAPSGWSEGLHVGDHALPPKFRTARCGEIALRARYGYAVPWPTPAGPGERTGWMEVGIALHRRLAAVLRTEEVFPHAAFLHLAGARTLPRKSSAAGARRRAELLADRLAVGVDELARWSVDARDAAAAAVTARDVARGTAEVAACAEHPASTPIHLPAPRTVPR